MMLFSSVFISLWCERRESLRYIRERALSGGVKKVMIFVVWGCLEHFSLVVDGV